MMAAYLLRPNLPNTHVQDPRWMKVYLRMVGWCLHHRLVTLVLSVGFFAGSIALIPLLPQDFLPGDDNSQTQITLELQPGSALVETMEAAELARKVVMPMPEVRSVYTTIGAGSVGGDPFSATDAAEIRRATLTIQLAPRGERQKKSIIENRIRKELEAVPAVRTKVGLGSSGETYILVLTGDDPQALQLAARSVERDLRTIIGLGNVSSSASLVRPEIVARLDNARATDLGVTSASIGETIRIATLGDYDAALPKLSLEQRQVPIVVRLDEGARGDLSVIERLSVPSSRTPVMLAQVATLELTGGPAVIDRFDRARNISFEIEISDLPLGKVTKAVHALPSVRDLPQGVRIIEVGDAEVMEELFASFSLAMLTGVVCIFIVLTLLFKDLLHPLTILVSLPLALGGAFVALLATNQSFSMPSLIGLIMLMGIATKNSILLVEYVIAAQRDQGLGRLDALVGACHKRARPIVMTSIAMGAGMLPIAASWGAADPSFRSPMAICVIGGLITSTLLSLLVIPVVYDLLEDARLGFARWWLLVSSKRRSSE
jgi:multidrug efflux pump subunit AcrB